jgi:hypothetical protein
MYREILVGCVGPIFADISETRCRVLTLKRAFLPRDARRRDLC